ncbi:glutamate racemase [Candidatus Endobugula sertula]|uniref:Glutamate racemase n=1 Tax=Candidatus Endobugula sertula TaxID=62101 RepID=A0A1D2QRL6_9GAMM|nr:glutamate racemase [Candidatus Endobugula sertula]
MSHKRFAKILVFDSGVGGLSILQSVRQQFPDCTLFYGSDNAAFPYGTKAEAELIERVDDVLHQLQKTTQADIIIIACNTASTVALPRIRGRFSQPVIGVVPAIKPAAKISQTKTIGLLATPGTVKRDYTEKLIKEFATHCHIIRVGSNELVHLVEKKLRGETIDPSQLKPIVYPFTECLDIDTIVLACTHFPLLKQELQQTLPAITYWVDSGEAIARRTGYWLDQLKLRPLDMTEQSCDLMKNSGPVSSVAFFTRQDKNLAALKTTLQQLSIPNIAILNK